MHHATVDPVHLVKAPESKAAATTQKVSLGRLCFGVPKADDDEIREMDELGVDLEYARGCDEL